MTIFSKPFLKSQNDIGFTKTWCWKQVFNINFRKSFLKKASFPFSLLLYCALSISHAIISHTNPRLSLAPFLLLSIVFVVAVEAFFCAIMLVILYEGKNSPEALSVFYFYSCFFHPQRFSNSFWRFRFQEPSSHYALSLAHLCEAKPCHTTSLHHCSVAATLPHFFS